MSKLALALALMVSFLACADSRGQSPATGSPRPLAPSLETKPVPKNASTLSQGEIEKLLGEEQFRIIRRVSQVPNAVRESFSSFTGLPFDLANPGEIISGDVGG